MNSGGGHSLGETVDMGVVGVVGVVQLLTHSINRQTSLPPDAPCATLRDS